jgi:hypothetical protein
MADFPAELRNKIRASAERTPICVLQRKKSADDPIRRGSFGGRSLLRAGFRRLAGRSTTRRSTPFAEPKEKPPDLGHEPPHSCPRWAGRTRNPCGSLPAAALDDIVATRSRPSASRAASRPRRQPEPRASTPDVGDEAHSCGLNQGAPAGWLSIVCLGDYRRPGAIVVARRSIRRALNRQIRGLASNPATHIEKFFADSLR